MPTLRQELEKINTGRWIADTGRIVRVDLVTPVRCDLMPAWLAERVTAHAQHFDWGIPFNPWQVLQILGLPGWNQWGSATDAGGREVFVSEPIPRTEQGAVAYVAERLKIAMAFSIDLYCHVLAPKGTWR